MSVVSELTCGYPQMGTSTIAKLTVFRPHLAIIARGIRQPSSPFDWLGSELERDYSNSKSEEAAEE